MPDFSPIFKDFPHMLHGADYNPEQWRDTPEIWDKDMELMKKANFNEMTMGIFSWAEIEPRENVYDFSVLDTMMDKIYANDGRVILATPSAARPHWLCDKYPDVLKVNDHGVREHFRARHNFCSSSPSYRERVRIINEKLSERYANHPALIGWHLSNEYGNALLDGFCYCDKCIEKFRAWLKDKYKTIDNLNHAWWTRFWSHRFDDFSQVEPPYLEIGNLSLYGLRLDWKRFTNDNILDFMKEEIKAVRKYSDKPVTTNGMCTYSGLDYNKFAKELDFFSQDLYPAWERGMSESNFFGLVCDYTRGLKDGKSFMVMESAPGSVCSGLNFCKIKSSRQQHMEAVKYIAHGADSVLYFQWRKGRGASEKFHGAVVDHYGKEDTRIFRTVSETGKMLKKLDCIAGSRVKSEVAIAFDTPTWWALGQLKPSTTDNGYLDTVRSIYGAFRRKNIPTDVIGYDKDFSNYKIVVLPSPYLMTEEFANKIKNYVQSGGTIISTYLSAVTDENDLCHLGGVPACGLTEVFGLRVEEVDSYCNPQHPELKNFALYNGTKYEVEGIAEVIVADTCKKLAEYTSSFYAGSCAVTYNTYGYGKSYYIAFQTGDEFYNDFVENITKEYNLKPPVNIIADEEVCIRKRENGNNSFCFVINESDKEKHIEFDKEYIDLLNDNTVMGKKTLPPYGFYILKEKE